MQSYLQEFIDYVLAQGVLKFGSFTLKSGRISPYFFNAGALNTGEALMRLGRCYAQKILEQQIPFDMLFGPAYKGIPLVAATAMGLYEQTGQSLPYCFDRKEPKQHGEGGLLVGAPMNGRVLIIDDVITAGTAIKHSIQLIREHHAALAGIVVIFDRQERGEAGVSAVEEISEKFFTTVTSICNFSDLIRYVEQAPGFSEIRDSLYQYREEYGVAVQS